MALADFVTTVVLAPHPYTRRLAAVRRCCACRGDDASLHWILIQDERGRRYDAAAIATREQEIAAVSDRFRSIAGSIAVRRGDARFGADRDARAGDGRRLRRVAAETFLMPFRRMPTAITRARSRSARLCQVVSPTHLRRIMCYEVPSETGFNLDPTRAAFEPNCYIKVSDEQIEEKIRIMAEYRTEMAPFPFPRSPEAMRALARVRGSECGATSAEAFVVVRDIC